MKPEGMWDCRLCRKSNHDNRDSCAGCGWARHATPDQVNHPPHYTTGTVECIDAIKESLGDGFKSYLRGNVIKYLWRAEHKGNEKQDYEKAQWYLNRLIEETE